MRCSLVSCTDVELLVFYYFVLFYFETVTRKNIEKKIRTCTLHFLDLERVFDLMSRDIV